MTEEPTTSGGTAGASGAEAGAGDEAAQKALRRIYRAWEKIRDQLVDVDEEKFLARPEIQDVVIAELVAVGEAVGQLPGEVRRQDTWLEWDELARMPEQFAGGRESSDLKLVWARATNEMYELRELITGMEDDAGDAGW